MSKHEQTTIGWEEQQLADPADGWDLKIDSGRRRLRLRLRSNTSTSPLLAGGDVDAQWEMAESVGDETIGGSTPTPDQNVVEELGQAFGIVYDDFEELWFGEKERERDRHRWELDPASAEDWIERRRRFTH